MHGYTEEGKNRQTVIFWLTVISIILGAGITYGLNVLIEFINKKIEIEILILCITLIFGVSASGIFGLIYWMFDKFFWKIKIFRNHDLSGKYQCHGISKDKSQKEKDEFDAIITIKQTWTKITIHLDAKQSFSDSFMASLSVNGIGDIRLDYSYKNSTKQTNRDMVSSHTGTANLIFAADIRGKYYNQPDDRMRYGELVLIKEGKNNAV